MMKRVLIFILACCAVTTAVMLGQSQAYRDRWVYVSSGLDTDQELEQIEGIARTASEHGMNGMLLSAGFDMMDLRSPEFLARITRLKQTCDHLGVEIIPAGFGVGYGGGVLAHDKNLAAGLPVRGALFVAGEHEARFHSDPTVQLANGNFEKYTGSMPTGFTAHGASATLDAVVSHSGKASVRFEGFSGPEGEVYVAQPLRVHPYRCYRLREIGRAHV
jgi:hypothetical protein